MPCSLLCNCHAVCLVFTWLHFGNRKETSVCYFMITSCQSSGSLINFYPLWGEMVLHKQWEMSVMQNQYLKHPHELKNNSTIHGRKIHWKLLIQRKYFWLRKSLSCRKLGNHCFCNFPYTLWLTTLGDEIRVKQIVDMTGCNCSYVLILNSCVPWEEWTSASENGWSQQHPAENCPQQSVSLWQIVAISYGCSLHWQQRGIEMSHTLGGPRQMQNRMILVVG